ncbi:tRNA (adenosine(37)-N6)-threonylcarbamoyltransferase complex dimerization subunit type 1 TsaB [Tropheryma whipplei]|uniref:tRNA (adenosine(37)-N6)-threonylcarbamoyltransferase complex dimerization subunit type 1 TsaB n=1 Tax=Tropheryma whipplei TaxID=2039 RepID=UPI0004B61D17|nr:tRNA (adenosine(37)-N6)-threonylcarbamoyltransferase complex dimerization subunit type 1 TsaB [Tropheryma whipplei]
MKILAIDTSSRLAIACLEIDNNRITTVGKCIEDSGRLHSELIAEAISQACSELQSLSFIAVCLGPGFYTGLRSGLVAARILGLSLSIPVYGVMVHDAIYMGYLSCEEHVFCDRGLHTSQVFSHHEPVSKSADGANHEEFCDRNTYSMGDAIHRNVPSIARTIITPAGRRQFYWSRYTGLDNDGLPIIYAGPGLIDSCDINILSQDFPFNPVFVASAHEPQFEAQKESNGTLTGSPRPRRTGRHIDRGSCPPNVSSTIPPGIFRARVPQAHDCAINVVSKNSMRETDTLKTDASIDKSITSDRPNTQPILPVSAVNPVILGKLAYLQLKAKRACSRIEPFYMRRADVTLRVPSGEINKDLVSIHPASLHDLPDIMKIERGSFTGEEWSSATMLQQLRLGSYFVLKVSDMPVGYAGISHPRFEDVDLETLAIDPAWRRKGLGGILLRHLFEYARDAGVKRCFLEVKVCNLPAIGMYKKHGFVTLGRRPKYYNGVDAITMKKEL